MYRFAGRELDPQRRELRHLGEPVHLEPQAFDLLVYLVRQRERVVSNSELLNAVWGHEFLSDSVLTTRMKEVRRAVGDDGRTQAVVRNFRGKGYRLVADVQAEGDDTGSTASSGGADSSAPLPPRTATEARLIGRDDDARLVIAALTDHRLVTITGPSGVGKSALARAVASMLDGQFDDGVHVVDLAAIAPGESLAPVVARALDIDFSSDRAESALRAAARLGALLVLDECEAHLEPVAALVNGLLTLPGSRMRILATSRMRLGLGSEFVAHLMPLHPAAAVELFLRRAGAVTAGRDREPPETVEVEAMVARLDHLPLAIEMAATRLGTMSLQELAAALDSDGGLTHLARQGQQQRHRELDDLVAASLDVLSADQRALFLDCSVFAGWFDAVAAEAVSSGNRSEPVVMSLSWLAECSLLQSGTRGGTTRYRMLATVRAVAGDLLVASGGTTATGERHALWVRDRLQQLDTELRTSIAAVERAPLDRLVDEARAANRWAQAADTGLVSELCGLLHLPAYTGLWHEPADWARRLTAAGSDGPGARVALAGMETHRGYLAAARTLLQQDVDTGSGRDRMNALEVLADAELYEGNLRRVLDLAARLGKEGASSSDPYAVAMSTVFTALARAYGGDTDGALSLLDRAQPFSGAPTMARGWLHYTRGEALAAQGRFATSADALQRAVAVGAETGHKYLVSVARTSLATVLNRNGDTDGAFAVMADCLGESRRNGNVVHAVTTMRNLVDMLVKSGRHREAVVVWAGAATANWAGSYGSESAMVREAVARAGTHLGVSVFEQCRNEGEQLGVYGVLDRSIDVITRLLP